MTYLSDPIELTWEQPEHETFALLGERIEDYLAAEFEDRCGDCVYEGDFAGPCWIHA